MLKSRNRGRNQLNVDIFVFLDNVVNSVHLFCLQARNLKHDKKSVREECAFT